MFAICLFTNLYSFIVFNNTSNIYMIVQHFFDFVLSLTTSPVMPLNLFMPPVAGTSDELEAALFKSAVEGSCKALFDISAEGGLVLF